jgi:hypothetical protein
MPNSPIDIRSRLELLVDGYLIDRMNGATLMLHSPSPQEVAIVFDRPWEGNTCGYVTVIEDGGLYKMYYRGSHHFYGEEEHSREPQVTCYAESTDGIHWEKPSLGLVEYEASKDNKTMAPLTRRIWRSGTRCGESTASTTVTSKTTGTSRRARPGTS